MAGPLAWDSDVRVRLPTLVTVPKRPPTGSYTFLWRAEMKQPANPLNAMWCPKNYLTRSPSVPRLSTITLRVLQMSSRIARLQLLGISSDHWVLLSLLAASLAVNVYQFAHRGSQTPIDPRMASQLRKGDKLSSLETGGPPNSATISLHGQPTVLYVTSPTCGWCRVNEPAIRALHAQAGNRWRFVGVSFVEEGSKQSDSLVSPLPFTTYVVNRTKSSFGKRIAGTPTTAVLSEEGVVVQAWPGAYVGETKHSIEQFLQATLPAIELPTASNPAP